MQTIIPLNDGSGLRLTTAKYYTPNHRSIQEKGVTPDIIVEDKVPVEAPAGEKPQYIREKDLMNHFKGEAAKKEEKTAEVPADKKSPFKIKPDSEDPPLDTAIQILKNWETFSKGNKNIKKAS